MQELFGEPMRDPVELAPYDPAWPERFQGFRERIADMLGAGVRIDQVGSTSVPGLLAEPVIDSRWRSPTWRTRQTTGRAWSLWAGRFAGAAPSAGSSAPRTATC